MSDLITTGGAAVTMTSLELVDFINSQRGEGEATLAHSDFLKKVPCVLGEAVAGNFSGYYKASNGKQNPMYTFPKREACLMAMSYSYDLQAKVFDKMTALEAKANTFDPDSLTRMDILKIALESEQGRLEAVAKVEALTVVVDRQTPKVEAFDRIATVSDGSFAIREAAKMLQTQERGLYQVLQAKHWAYRHPMSSTWLAYSDVLQKGYMEHKTAEGDRPDGGRWQKIQARITAKGLAQLSMMFGKPGDGAQGTIPA
jgi:phage antirepressor YoqD-like protein